jgi:transcriptional regulator with XRE-family HTH domain
MSIKTNTIGYTVREARKEKRYTLREMAKKMNITEVAYSRKERLDLFRTKDLYKVAKILDMKITIRFTDKKNENSGN